MLYSPDTSIYLLPGQHLLTSPVEITRTIELWGDPDARVVSANYNSGRLHFAPGSEGSKVYGLRLASASPWDFAAVTVEVDSESFFAQGLSFESVWSGDVMLALHSTGTRIEDLLFRSVSGARMVGVSSGAQAELIGVTLEDVSAFPYALEVFEGSLEITDLDLLGSSNVFTTSQYAVGSTDSTLVLEDVNLVTESGTGYYGYMGPISLLEAHGGSVTAKQVFIRGTEPMQAPAIFVNGADSFVLEESVLTEMAHSVKVTETALVTVDGTIFDELEAAPLTLDHVPNANITDSWFCASFSPDSGGSVALTASCELGCTVEGSVFVGSYSQGGGGAIFADSGLLNIAHSTFRGSLARDVGEAMSVGEDAQLLVSHSLFAGGANDKPVLAGGQTTLEWVGTDAVLIAGEASVLGQVMEGVTPVWIERWQSHCGESVVLSDEPANAWFIENRVGAFVPCWYDEDGDQLGGEIVPNSVGSCEDLGLVSRGGDCDDLDETRTTGPECHPDDRDMDGVTVDVDCNDEDPAIGECRMRWASGCTTSSSPSPLFAHAILALLALRWKLKAG